MSRYAEVFERSLTGPAAFWGEAARAIAGHPARRASPGSREPRNRLPAGSGARGYAPQRLAVRGYSCEGTTTTGHFA